MLENLFEDYSNVGGIQIVKILGFDAFLAIMTSKKGKEKLTMVRRMNDLLMEKLKDNELTVDEVLGEVYQWHSLQSLEECLGQDLINDMIKVAESEGHVVKKDGESKENDGGKNNQSREQGVKKNTKSKWFGLKKRKK